jgi:hypothetical protein
MTEFQPPSGMAVGLTTLMGYEGVVPLAIPPKELYEYVLGCTSMARVVGPDEAVTCHAREHLRRTPLGGTWAYRCLQP